MTALPDPSVDSTRLLANLTAGKTHTMVAYGTSLTEGGRWVADLAGWLEARYPRLATVINAGISGCASNTALVNLEDRVLVHRPDTVIIEFAVNDAFSYAIGDADHGISPQQSRANLNQLIDLILQSNPDAEIILQTMNPAWDAPNGNGSASKRPYLENYYEGYRAVASARGLRLIDHHANWLRLLAADRNQFEHYVPDGVHPTPEGATAVVFDELVACLSGQSR